MKISNLKFKIQEQSGQVLLVVVMLLATAITVVLSLSFKSVTETQITKLEEENQKALAAAEAAIEASLKVGTTTLGSGVLSNISGFTGGASVSTATGTTFTTSLLQPDEQYTFFLADYPGLTTNYWAGDLTVYFESGSDSAVELTVIKSDNSLEHKLIDPHTLINGASKTAAAAGGTINGISFGHKYSTTIANIKLLIVRPLSAATKLGFAGDSNLPSQGKTVTSTAQSTTGGVKKSVSLFQSYPQIPAEFFVTSF